MYNTDYNFCTLVDLKALEGNDAEIEAALEAARANLEPKEIEYTRKRVEPDEIEVGDLLAYYGFVGRVEKIKTYPCKYALKGLAYGISVSYIGGDVEKFKYFRGRVCNGCLAGELSYIQGNDLAFWHKAELTEETTVA